MTDLQLMTLCMSIALPIAMLIYSNSRVSDVKGLLDGRISDLKSAVDGRVSEMKETLRAEMALGFGRLENKVDHLAEEVAVLKDLLSAHLREHHGIR